jgi:hypothetical protein
MSQFLGLDLCDDQILASPGDEHIGVRGPD